MICFLYDKTFEGLLSTVFYAYTNKCFPNRLLNIDETLTSLTDSSLTLFDNIFNTSQDTIIKISTSTVKANRVWKGLTKKLSPSAANSITTVWLSELENTDELIFRYICKALDYKSSTPNIQSIELNFADKDVLQMSKIWKKVSNEQLRVIQFVRFQKAKDGTYFAPIEPQYNVLSLTIPHFTNRFADQEWIVYDLHRKYGYYYNKISTTEISFKDEPGNFPNSLMADNEQLYEELWKTYFNAVCIKERINPKLHKQNLPVRFWKHLTEKQTSSPD